MQLRAKYEVALWLVARRILKTAFLEWVKGTHRCRQAQHERQEQRMRAVKPHTQRAVQQLGSLRNAARIGAAASRHAP